MGEGHSWKKIVIGMTGSARRNTPGLEQVAFSRATTPDAVDIANDVTLCIDDFFFNWKGLSISNAETI